MHIRIPDTPNGGGREDALRDCSHYRPPPNSGMLTVRRAPTCAHRGKGIKGCGNNTGYCDCPSARLVLRSTNTVSQARPSASPPLAPLPLAQAPPKAQKTTVVVLAQGGKFEEAKYDMVRKTTVSRGSGACARAVLAQKGGGAVTTGPHTCPPPLFYENRLRSGQQGADGVTVFRAPLRQLEGVGAVVRCHRGCMA